MSGGAAPGRAHGWAVTAADVVFDALAAPSAVVDHRGVIIAVNRAWRQLSDADGGDPHHPGVGVDYPAMYERAAAAGSDEAGAAHRGLTAVLAGDSSFFELELVCPTAGRARWFLMEVAPVPGIGVVVQHVEITRRKRLEQRLAHLAGHDPLTGVWNRTALEQDLDRLLRPAGGRRVGVLFADLDGFKAVNDTHGHLVGDEVLTQVAGRIRSCVRPDDVVARVGGDEFVVVTDDPDVDDGLVARLGERLHGVIVQPYRVRATRVSIGVSIGSVVADPGDDVRAVLHRADRDMYRAKPGAARRHPGGGDGLTGGCRAP